MPDTFIINEQNWAKWLREKLIENQGFPPGGDGVTQVYVDGKDDEIRLSVSNLKTEKDGELDGITSRISDSENDIQTVEESLQDLSTAVAEIKTNPYYSIEEINGLLSAIETKITNLDTVVQNHKNADNSRWNSIELFKQEVYNFMAGVENAIPDPDPANTIDIESEAQGSGYTVTNSLGGEIHYKDVVVLLDIIPGKVSVNGEEVWNTDALGLGEVGGAWKVKNGDVITASGITSITFTPYISGS